MEIIFIFLTKDSNSDMTLKKGEYSRSKRTGENFGAGMVTVIHHARSIIYLFFSFVKLVSVNSVFIHLFLYSSGRAKVTFL